MTEEEWLGVSVSCMYSSRESRKVSDPRSISMSGRFICISLFSFWVLGCRVAEETPKVSSIRITPTEFFSGDLKRLKPHVDFRAACFKVTTQGPVECRGSVEMWCDGERVGISKSEGNLDTNAGEVTLSWRRKSFPRGGTTRLF